MKLFTIFLILAIIVSSQQSPLMSYSKGGLGLTHTPDTLVVRYKLRRCNGWYMSKIGQTCKDIAKQMGVKPIIMLFRNTHMVPVCKKNDRPLKEAYPICPERRY